MSCFVVADLKIICSTSCFFCLLPLSLQFNNVLNMYGFLFHILITFPVVFVTYIFFQINDAVNSIPLRYAFVLLCVHTASIFCGCPLLWWLDPCSIPVIICMFIILNRYPHTAFTYFQLIVLYLARDFVFCCCDFHYYMNVALHRLF